MAGGQKPQGSVHMVLILQFDPNEHDALGNVDSGCGALSLPKRTQHTAYLSGPWSEDSMKPVMNIHQNSSETSLKATHTRNGSRTFPRRPLFVVFTHMGSELWEPQVYGHRSSRYP